MGKRRRRLKPGGPRIQYTSTAQLRMLDLTRKDEFKYHLTRLLDKSEMKADHQRTFIANLLSQASQNSIEEAKSYLRSVVEQGLLDDTTSKKIERLLDTNATHR